MLKIKKCNVAGLVARLGGFQCDEGMVTGMIFAERSVRFDPATFTKTILDEFIQQDKIIGNVKIDAAEDADVDPSYTDLANGKSIKNTIGLKKWNVSFYKNGCFQNELNKLDKSERYSVFLVFEDGSVLGAQLKDGMIKGFDVTLFTGIKKVKTAAEGGGSTLRIDLTTSAMKYWQGSSVSFVADDVEFDELNPIAGLQIVKTEPLTAGDTTTKLEVSNLCADSKVSGLTTPANWKLRRNGVLEAITTITEVEGVYTFTHAALVANDTVSFETNQAGYPVYVLDTDYYAGKSDPEKVA
ncbi:hypothetical protein BN1195_03606 [Chryseobacterium oranimense G311]|uniref:hypothetical protein n=1 Tax=Chryseobacterium oranimense TaxID=421058 RepID=UPI000533B9B6|nr:hypothetical protein [Chryseobacterium oranimense]CEJ71261.1 hypothetical protein BN1195_03606 [Chryseobacterium oranimense G311]DAG72872.1 MAG TPA: hypothetical protein [Caudoviricetes sp.]